jgi:hypothetical protein
LTEQDFKPLSSMVAFRNFARANRLEEGIPEEVARLLPVCDHCGHRKTTAAESACFNMCGFLEPCGCKCDQFGRHKLKAI